MSKGFVISRHAAHRDGQSKRHDTIAAMPRPLVLVLISSLLGCGLPGLAEGRESRPRSLLATAPGLEKRVTYSETKIPLGELVAKVAADTGVSLNAARDVVDEPVAVVVNEFPARELLEHLAELLDYSWSRRARPSGRAGQRASDRSDSPQGPTPVYEIYQDLASKQREEALRQALSASVEQRFQEGMAICRELAGKSQEEMRQLWDEPTRWKERLEKLTPEERQALENSPEGRQQSMRHFLARYLWSPIQRSLAGFMIRLTPEQWATLRSGQQLVFSSDPQRGKLPLPPDVLRGFRTSRPSVSPPGQLYSARPEREERKRREEREMQERWDQAEHYDVILRLLAFESTWWDPGCIQFGAITAPFRGGKRLGQQDDNPSFYLNIASEQALPQAEEDPGRRVLLEQDPLLSLRKAFQPDTRPYVDPLFPGASRTFRLLPEILPELARAFGVQFIADSYWNAPSVSSLSSSAGLRPLFEVLNGLTAPGYISSGAPFVWDRRGSLIRIRNQKWFLDRPREIPLRHVRRWVERVDRLGALPLEEYASLARTLTDLQVETLEGLFQRGLFPPHLDGDDLEEARSLLRLYARLSPAQRQALQAGQPLATAQLAPALRPFVLAHLYRVNRSRIPLPDLEPWDGGYLSLSRTPAVRIREQRGRSVTWRLESAPAPGSTTRPDAVTRFPVMHLEMRLHYGPQQSHALRLIVAGRSVPLE